MSGSFLLGLVLAALSERALPLSNEIRLAAAVGFLGAYTTFSTFEHECHALLEDGEWAFALVNMFGSLFLGLLALSILAGPERAAAAGRKALLIGINEYMAVPDLRGALNDIELIRDVLVTRFGFAAEDIEVLTNEQATRDNMLAAFERLDHAGH